MSAAPQPLSDALAEFAVLEAGDERGEFAGLLLAGLGAEVIRIEPPGGAPSRWLGPFDGDAPDPERSLHFWRYNLNKKSLSLDLDNPAAAPVFARIAAHADVILDSGEANAIDRRLAMYRELRAANPRLIVCTITPFGLDGPYRDFKMTDLTQMAMGGIMAVCGYEPGPDGKYDTAPIAPAAWHSYHLASEYAAVSITAALNFRELAGEGQEIDLSIHEAVNTCTEFTMPSYIYSGVVVKRQTARHAGGSISPPWLRRAADGVYLNAIIAPTEREFRAFVRLLDESAVAHNLNSEAFSDASKRGKRDAQREIFAALDRLVSSMPAEEVFRRAQALGLAWAPVRRPEENLDDPHFQKRGSFAAIAHPELGRELFYPASVATNGERPHFGFDRRAPRLGEHTDQILGRAGLAPAEIAALRAAKIV
ncbi:MAG TPA: CoA transferase [Candidatus Binataceae bacterium]|nr:CoA transferase [Candidatus Binataceae bacterium]